MSIELGSKVKDVITGFDGIAMGRCIWLTGCAQYIVTPQGLDKDGKRRDGEWFDEARLVVVEPPSSELKAALGNSASADPGGPRDYPAQRFGG